MINIEAVVDSAKNAIDSLQDYGEQASNAFERIADLARNADEENWQNVINEIFDIAYSNY